jgi:hypothetical protein
MSLEVVRLAPDAEQMEGRGLTGRHRHHDEFDESPPSARQSETHEEHRP